jgi:HrpA-like RNA helicase
VLALRDVRAVLHQCLSPPPAAAVESAVALLRQIGAFSPEEDLTSLGWILQQLPMDPR